MPKRLLILSCSQHKRPDEGELPAIERYDGPQFQIVRKFLRTHPIESKSLMIFILSARFGLIPASQPIPTYNRRMTPKRAKKLRPKALDQLAQLLPGCDEMLVQPDYPCKAQGIVVGKSQAKRA